MSYLGVAYHSGEESFYASISIVMSDLNSTVKWSAKTVMLYELFDQSLIKSCDVGFLPSDEVL